MDDAEIGNRQEAVGNSVSPTANLNPTASVGINCARLLPTAYCLLPTAYCLLPTAYCLLPQLALSIVANMEPILSFNSGSAPNA